MQNPVTFLRFKTMESYKLFKNIKYSDDRGFFYESFSRIVNDDLGINFCQDNVSYSKKGVVRGLHYQWDKPMGKLIHVISGKIIDYIVDIRKSSPNLGKSYHFELSEENGNLLWVPPGYAHGFVSLEDSYVMYKCSSFYNKDCESAINIFDADINLPLDICKEEAIISQKDKDAQSFLQYLQDPKF